MCWIGKPKWRSAYRWKGIPNLGATLHKPTLPLCAHYVHEPASLNWRFCCPRINYAHKRRVMLAGISKARFSPEFDCNSSPHGRFKRYFTHASIASVGFFFDDSLYRINMFVGKRFLASNEQRG